MYHYAIDIYLHTYLLTYLLSFKTTSNYRLFLLLMVSTSVRSIAVISERLINSDRQTYPAVAAVVCGIGTANIVCQ